ncbi:MAG: NADP-dependent malic enzyme [Mycoplasma sp.]|nr:NADP-dependent malic enzyme [Mycoplasma sp.]
MSKALEIHKKLKGKLKTTLKHDITSYKDLSILYSPGVAEPCKEIYNDNSKIYDYTMKGNTVAIISNGTAVLGLGDIGADASLPVMEGKAVLLKKFAGVNAFPICINEKNTDKLIDIIKSISTTFGAINLEDIASPECFEIEKRLQQEMNIPVFHDDQHGTSIVVVAALVNACRVLNKKIEDLVICQSGTGAAGLNIIKTLHKLKVKKYFCYNINGVVNSLTKAKNNKYVNDLLEKGVISDNDKQTLSEIIAQSDVFIGVSVANIVTAKMVEAMKENPIIIAMANPNPEISFEEVSKTNYGIYGTGRSDLPNQINNVLAFPGVLKALLESDVKVIDEELKIKIGYAIASLVESNKLSKNFILPSLFDSSVVDAIVKTVKESSK